MTLAVAALVAFAPAAFAAKSPKCTDFRLSWQIDDSINNKAIGSDHGGPYVDGQQGTVSTGHICVGSDATLGIDENQRTIYFDFSRQVAPEVATRTDLITYGGNFLNVRSLLSGYMTTSGDRRNDEYWFSTQMMGYITFGTLRMNPGGDVVVNSPYKTSAVSVTHYAAPDERFVVTPLPTTSAEPDVAGKPIASILVTKGRTTTNIGQFETQFSITIRILR